MAQQQRAIRTRRQIVEAAAEVFAERGYAAASISEILSRAGVTKGSLYFHFASKEALLHGVLEGQLTGEELPARSSKLQEWVDTGMVLAHRFPRDPVLRAGSQLLIDPSLQTLFRVGPQEGWIDVTAALLAEAKKRGEVLPHVVPRQTARFVVASFNGILILSKAGSHLADLEEEVSVFYRHVLPGIAVPAVLAHLDAAPDRGARVVAEMERPTASV
ncbi:ScbR family autoregulator-binding transcription factor [Streptomyces sp. 7N604]|uniref:ScbR family autoregulator-binding transcription factor n=1 Tax=Streptomyces sp. 7N604 TaxID=3457415 RepID=UPI003FCF8FE0